MAYCSRGQCVPAVLQLLTLHSSNVATVTTCSVRDLHLRGALACKRQQIRSKIVGVAQRLIETRVAKEFLQMFRARRHHKVAQSSIGRRSGLNLVRIEATTYASGLAKIWAKHLWRREGE
jgi:tRNA isopentenyl-2-thiomethyl-A-37 hydroxylase MiaE